MKKNNPSRKHYFLRCKEGNFYIFGNLKQWCKDNGYSVLILRSNENLGVICKKFEKDNSFSMPQKAKLLGAEFFSFTQAEFLELATEKKEKLINDEWKVTYQLVTTNLHQIFRMFFKFFDEIPLNELADFNKFKEIIMNTKYKTYI